MHILSPYVDICFLIFLHVHVLQVGFDAVYFGRIDYQDRAKRKVEKNLEVVWRGSKTLGSSSQVNYRFSFPPSLSSFLFIEG